MQPREKQFLAWLLAVAAWSVTTRGAAQPVDLEIEAETETTPSPTSDVTPDIGSSSDLAALRETIQRLEARLDAVEAESEDGVLDYEDEAALEEPAAEEPSWWDRLDLRVSGYIQTQLVTSQLSHDEIGPDGSPLNQDRFVIRRGRLRVDRVWEYASLSLELDGSTTRGPFVGLRRAEVSFFLPNFLDDETDVPYVAATVGLTSTPFGYELRVPNRERWFMERSTGSLAFQRGEPDVGARLWGGVGILRYDVAVMNGNPLDDRAGGEPIDLTGAKDVVGRVGLETNRSSNFSLAAGVSFHVGTGLSPGTPATKPQFTWVDVDEDGEFDAGFETFTSPGQAATPSETFRRWGWNADLQIGFRTRIGWTRFYGEATIAENLDRSMYIANPVTAGEDIREFAWYGAFLQEITPYAVVGFRVDSYNPNSDLFETRAGIASLRDATILTLSPLVGGALPGRGRLVFQYDRVLDHLGRDASGVPTDLSNDQFIFRLQLEF